MIRAALKSLRARKRRSVMTAISIILGVGFVAGTYVLTDTMNAAFDQLFSAATSGTDVVVRSASAFGPTVGEGPGGGGPAEERKPLPQSLVGEIQNVQGVNSASGSVSGYAQIVDPTTGKPIGGVGPPTIGANWNTTANATLTLRSGHAPEGSDQVVVDAFSASKYDLKVGQSVRVLFEGPPEEFRISGIAGFGEADSLGGATLAMFDTPTAQRVLGREGEFDQIDVVGEKGVTPLQLRADIQPVLPKGAEAVTSSSVAAEQAEQVKEGLGFFRTALLVFAGVALFVGAFSIFNTFSIIVAQRTRELALFRTLGASRGQVMSSVVLEALLLGLVGSAIGILVGVGIAIGLKGLLAAFGLELPGTSMQIEARTVVVSMVVGTVVAVAASIFPAWKAASVAPLQALRDAGEGGDMGRKRLRLVVGGAILAVGIGGLLYGLFGNASSAGLLIGFGAAITFIGVAVLAALVSRPLAGAIGAPVGHLGVQGQLGRENAMRNPRRTASTSSALMIGLGLVAMVAILSASLKASFTATLESTLKADLILSTSSFTPFSPDVVRAVGDVSGVAAVSEFRQGVMKVAGSTAAVTGVDPSTIGLVTDVQPSEGALEGLDSDGLLVAEDVAAKHGWSTGDKVPVVFAATGPQELTLAGTMGQSDFVGDYVIPMELYKKVFSQQLDLFAMVKLDEGADSAKVVSEIQSATKEFGNIEVQDQAAFRDKQAGFVDQLLGLVTALLAMAIIIALFGIANTLGLSILERTRELGLLRAVGMSKRQLKRMIRWESIIIAVLGALLGLAIGVFFGWCLQQALAPEGVTKLVVPVGQLIVYLLFAALAGVLAAIWPSRRAAKLDVLQAISYE